jgi:hypothetical protein
VTFRLSIFCQDRRFVAPRATVHTNTRTGRRLCSSLSSTVKKKPLEHPDRKQRCSRMDYSRTTFSMRPQQFARLLRRLHRQDWAARPPQPPAASFQPAYRKCLGSTPRPCVAEAFPIKPSDYPAKWSFIFDVLPLGSTIPFADSRPFRHDWLSALAYVHRSTHSSKCAAKGVRREVSPS